MGRAPGCCSRSVGWLAGSVVAQVRADQRDQFAAACGVIRRNGACDITFSLVEA